MILVSACLAGLNCRYDGNNKFQKDIFNLVKEGKAILVCPEQLGGLKTPRLPAEIKHINGHKKVITLDGQDVTTEYERGAKEVLGLAKSLNISDAIFKSKSPACGCGKIYDGTFSGNTIIGNGITTELLLANGINVTTEEEYLKANKKLGV